MVAAGNYARQDWIHVVERQLVRATLGDMEATVKSCSKSLHHVGAVAFKTGQLERWKKMHVHE